jgi:hypothetical protein
MKFTVSTLLALAIAAPAVLGTGFPVSISIESSLNWGEMKVFGDVNDGDYVKLGQLAQKIGDLHFMEPGMQIFSIHDDRAEGTEHKDQYYNVSLSTTADRAHANEISVMLRLLRIRDWGLGSI